MAIGRYYVYFFFNDTATTEIYTLSLHDALPILGGGERDAGIADRGAERGAAAGDVGVVRHRERAADAGSGVAVHEGVVLQEDARSEEHTSELQSRQYLVCRLLLEKKKRKL